MKNVVQMGLILTLTASRAVLAGEGMLRGNTFGVALNDTANATPGEFALEGVFTLPKVGSQVQGEGATVYWDNTNFNVTTTASGNTKIGVVATVGGHISAATSGNYRLIPTI
jgi:predicted RecA/RadA family phage recombinase